MPRALWPAALAGQNHWDHVISKDLIHWQRLPPPIQPLKLKTWDGSISMLPASDGGPIILYDAQDGKLGPWSSRNLSAPLDSPILGVARLADPNDKYLQKWTRVVRTPPLSLSPPAFSLVLLVRCGCAVLVVGCGRGRGRGVSSGVARCASRSLNQTVASPRPFVAGQQPRQVHGQGQRLPRPDLEERQLLEHGDARFGCLRTRVGRRRLCSCPACPARLANVYKPGVEYFFWHAVS